MDSIGSRIKLRRKELGLTQTQIKNMVGISTGNISDIENGKQLPATPTLINLSKALNCTIDWILTGNIQNSEIFIFSDKREMELLNFYKELPEDDKEEIWAITKLKYDRKKKSEKKSLILEAGKDAIDTA